MTDEMMALRGLLEKSADADLLREMMIVSHDALLHHVMGHDPVSLVQHGKTPVCRLGRKVDRGRRQGGARKRPADHSGNAGRDDASARNP